ncbi:hypothetical protein BT93_L3802 [Corymbia citriodora subsp. variegata]|uniref:Uncharacterized protein n=1 Tax=Corymbia citriodora subsp. variegata TaxID=360336 RepID=A0A8T0CHQ6_CORYI|nr:hypothetical protein BT93_L3802 [Corymbia citriodora subsp. variegata]
MDSSGNWAADPYAISMRQPEKLFSLPASPPVHRRATVDRRQRLAFGSIVPGFASRNASEELSLSPFLNCMPSIVPPLGFSCIGAYYICPSSTILASLLENWKSSRLESTNF